MFFLVFLSHLHAHLDVLDGFPRGFQGCDAMAAFIVLGFVQVLFRLFEGIERRLHVRLIVIVAVAGNRADGNAQQTQNQCKCKQS